MPRKKLEMPRKGIMRGSSMRKSMRETREIIVQQSVTPFRNKIDVPEVIKASLEKKSMRQNSFGPPIDQISRQKIPNAPVKDSKTTPLGMKLARRHPRACTELVNKIMMIDLPVKMRRRRRTKKAKDDKKEDTGDQKS
ncbi:unnamed protein product [Bursaphelenchus okinawaensis]|uniref:Uncharacterized protein n=1 Tax=Bursaphelenchus okinawaensis TaxID=465554 RepID=A0A811KDK7_9BILA|nr:unnamed protein product [Bursaphelenchus okinawaensis]CAG9101629.1 unnamed protein product [Bursaphelenchus okinawaensis]